MNLFETPEWSEWLDAFGLIFILLWDSIITFPQNIANLLVGNWIGQTFALIYLALVGAYAGSKFSTAPKDDEYLNENDY